MAQLVVRTRLNHAPLVEHVDAVRVFHGREPVCDDDDRDLSLQRVDTVLNMVRWERSDRVLSECATNIPAS